MVSCGLFWSVRSLGPDREMVLFLGKIFAKAAETLLTMKMEVGYKRRQCTGSSGTTRTFTEETHAEGPGVPEWF